MRIDINKIVPNRFRDFDIDPIDEAQVQRLVHSIEDLGFFSGVTARRLPDGTYELACGHHRWKAAEEAGWTHIEAVVDNYDDNKMRRIMAIENLTQRGADFGAVKDSVAAFAYQVAYDTLTDEPSEAVSESRKGLSEHQLQTKRTVVLKDGPGSPAIYEAINGFGRTELTARKKTDEKAELIKRQQVENAVAALKADGHMAKIVAAAYAVVEEERKAAADKAAEVERKAEAKRQADAEAARQREAEATAKAEAEAARKRREAEMAANDKRKRDAAKAAEERAKTQRREALHAEEQRRQAEANRRAKAQREAEEKRQREAEERARIRDQQAREKTYDSRCDLVFEKDADYIRVFRQQVTLPAVVEVIAFHQQYPLAQRIVKEMKAFDKFSSHKSGTSFITQAIDEVLQADNKAKQDAAKRMKLIAQQHNTKLQVKAWWDDIKSHIIGVEETMKKLVKAHADWDPSLGDFPANVSLTLLLGVTERIEEMATRMYPNDPGVRRWAEKHQASNGKSVKLLPSS